MLRRFTINDEGHLVDRDGLSLGKVAGITLDIPSGGKGVSSSVLGVLPQTKKNNPLAPGVDEVWAHWVQRREEIGKPLRKKEITPSNIRLITKGLKEVNGPGDLMRAIDGLTEWMKQRGGSADLSRILRTYPGGRPLAEQIEFFIGLVDGGVDGGTSATTPEEMVKVNRLKETITSGFDKPHRQEEVERAISELQSKGWTVEMPAGVVAGHRVSGDGGQLPRFLAP